MLTIAFVVLHLTATLSLIFLVLMHSGKGGGLSDMFGGSVVVEQVFALPGLGRLMVGAIAERNYPLVQASILLATLTFVIVNTLVDLLYAAVDPRISRA